MLVHLASTPPLSLATKHPRRISTGMTATMGLSLTGVETAATKSGQLRASRTPRFSFAAKECRRLSWDYVPAQRRCVERHRAGDGACPGVARRARRHGRPQRLHRARGQGGHRGQDPCRTDWRSGARPQLHSFRKEIRLQFWLSELASQHSHVSTNKSYYFVVPLLSRAVKSQPEIIVVPGCVWLVDLVFFFDSNNAGVMTRSCTRSCDGLELHFATNHIGVSSYTSTHYS